MLRADLDRVNAKHPAAAGELDAADDIKPADGSWRLPVDARAHGDDDDEGEDTAAAHLDANNGASGTPHPEKRLRLEGGLDHPTSPARRVQDIPQLYTLRDTIAARKRRIEVRHGALRGAARRGAGRQSRFAPLAHGSSRSRTTTTCSGATSRRRRATRLWSRCCTG